MIARFFSLTLFLVLFSETSFSQSREVLRNAEIEIEKYKYASDSIIKTLISIANDSLRNGQIITCKFDMLSFHPDDPSF